MSEVVASPRVTAIIIVFNGERFIGEAIASILAQTLTMWELLVVDDGSTDATGEIVARIAATDPRIQLLRHRDGGNHGMSATRNVGIAAARGEYIGFLDADDMWMPHKLAEQVAILDAAPQTAMVYGRTQIWHSWDPSSGAPDFFYSLGVPPNKTYPAPRLFDQLLENVHQTPTTCNALIRRDAVEAVGGFDPAFRTMFEDQLFFAKVMVDFPVYVSGRWWARYRQHDAATSAREADADVLALTHIRYLTALRHHLLRGGRRFRPERLTIERHLAIIRLRHVARTARSRLKRMMVR